VLRELFRLPEWSDHLTFKGGTSLSKCWHLIHRFSEDIDLVVDRSYLGFGAPALSTKQAKRLSAECARRIGEELLPSLSRRVAGELTEEAVAGLRVAGPEDDPDQQTVLFQYPTVFQNALSYLRPVVRVELGARSDTEPSERAGVAPFLAQDASFAVRAVSPRRTFWEKAMLLHEETGRPRGAERKPRMSRHYYDLWCLITAGVAAQALADTGLFERVAAHRRAFFRRGWVDYSTLRRGTLRLVPPANQVAAWRRDYVAMRDMLYGDSPSFGAILAAVESFQAEFNQ
jgi:hypothetical protein